MFVGSALRADLSPRYHLVYLVTLGDRQEYNWKRRPAMPPNRVSDFGWLVLQVSYARRPNRLAAKQPVVWCLLP